MKEIKTPLVELKPGESFTAESESFVFTEKHSIRDILRHLAEEASFQDILEVAEEMFKENLSA